MQVQLLNADVIKLGCEFVKQVVAINKKYKTTLEPCSNKLDEAFANYVKASLFLQYLSPSGIHCLMDAANKIDDSATNVSSTTCEAQASITIKKGTTTKTFTASLLNPYATASTVDNSSHISSQLTVIGPDNSNTIIYGRCNSTMCDDVLESTVYNIHRFNLPAFIDYQDSHISKLKLYETNSSGDFYTSHIVDLDPATSPYYLAAGVNPADAKLGSINFNVSLSRLINAFAATRPSLASTAHYISGIVLGNQLSLDNQCVHKGRRILGIDRNDVYVYIKSSIYGEMRINPYSSGIADSSSSFFYSGSFPTTCGSLMPKLSGIPTFNYNASLCNYNNIAFNSNKSNEPLVLTSNTKSCVINTYTASYSVIGNVVKRYWTTSYDPTKIESDTIVSNSSGTYYFTIELDSGCIITKSYTQLEVPTTVTPDDEIVA